jgi:hypothetical protein
VFHCRAAFALGLFVAMVSSANAQPEEKKPAPASPVYVLLDFVGDKNIEQELKLTAEQLKKFRDHRLKLWEEYHNTPLKNYTAKDSERNKATTAIFKDVLDAEQFKRAEQLAIQYEWSRVTFIMGPFAQRRERVVDPSRVSPEVLKEYPQLAELLELSYSQKKLLEAKRIITEAQYIILTQEQSEIAHFLFGKIVKLDWKFTSDLTYSSYPSWLFSSGPASPGPLGTTAAQDVRDELKLTEEQIKELAKLREPWTKFKTEWRELSPNDIKKKSDELLAATDKALAGILKPEQLTRLRQIALRAERDDSRTLTDAPTSLIPRLAKHLAVTPEQLQAFDAVRKKHALAVARAALNADELEAAWKAIRAANEAREKGFEDALTDEQRATLKALVGEPFTGSGQSDNGQFAQTFERVRARREASFGRYTDEIRLLSANKSIQEELKLTVDQIKASQDALKELTRRFGRQSGSGLVKEENGEERSKFIGTSIAAILDKDQAKRFRQIMLQNRQRMTSLIDIPSAVTYPGVAEEVKLSAAQKKQLITGDEQLDVLSDEQRKAIKDMLGEPFTGDYSTLSESGLGGKGGWGSTGFSNRSPSPEVARAQFLVIVPWDALQLKPEQVSKLVSAINAYEIAAAENNGIGGGGFGVAKAGRDPHEGAAHALNHRATLVLTPEQDSRLGQLLLQSAAAVNLRDALCRPEAEQLQLTPAQLTRMALAEEEFGKIAEGVVKSYMHFAPRSEVRNEVLKELRERLDTRILGVLTPEQLAKWKELTGEKWNGFTKPLLVGVPTRWSLR